MYYNFLIVLVIFKSYNIADSYNLISNLTNKVEFSELLLLKIYELLRCFISFGAIKVLKITHGTLIKHHSVCGVNFTILEVISEEI